uniref:Uncharacterized protein n=1 Tax=viral metagenome TaxID=1070528 RepID=A0A6C0IFH5_9ZZZZ
MLVIPLQLLKAPFPIVFTLFGIVRVLKLEHSLNAFKPIPVMLLVITILVKELEISANSLLGITPI